MPQVIDLSTLKKPFSDGSESAGETTKQAVQTALLLIKSEDGSWQATPDISVASQIEPQEAPDGQDMIAGLSIMLSDIQAEKTASMTMMLLAQQAQAQMQAMQSAQIAANLNLKH